MFRNLTISVYTCILALWLVIFIVHFQKKIHTHPKEGHWKFLGGGGVLKTKVLEAKYEANWNFLGGGGVQHK